VCLVQAHALTLGTASVPSGFLSLQCCRYAAANLRPAAEVTPTAHVLSFPLPFNPRWLPFRHVQEPAIALLAADYLAQLRTAAEAHLAVLASRKFSTDPRAALAMRLPTIVATAHAIVEASDSLLSIVSYQLLSVVSDRLLYSRVASCELLRSWLMWVRTGGGGAGERGAAGGHDGGTTMAPSA
jgi:hypothetical protein